MRRVAALALLAVLAGALAALAGPAGPASAHAYLASSSPADGAMLDRAPELIVLGFTEQVEVSATHVDIVDGDGRRYAPTSLTLRRPKDAGPEAGTGAGTEADTEEPADVVIGLPRLPANVYHLTWRTLSSDDLHATTGNLVFGVQRKVRAGAAAPGPAGPGPLETTLRATGLAGVCVLLGGLSLALLSGHAGTARRRLARVAAGAGVVALIATPALLAAQVYAATGGAGRFLLTELIGVRRLGYEAGIAALVAAALAARARPAVAVRVGAPAALVTAYTGMTLGHAANTSVVAQSATAVHLLAAGGWAGGVVAAAIALLPALRRGGSAAAEAGVLLRAFARLAVASVTLLAVTGLLMTGALVATVDALLTSPYGIILLVKAGAGAAAGLLGLRTARRLRRGGPIGPGIPRGLVAEASVLVGVLALAAALGSAGPARGPHFEAAAVRASTEVSGQAADLVDAVTIRPNRPGRNVVSVTVDDTRRPALAPVGGVSVLLRAPDGRYAVHPATRAADGQWVAMTDDIDTAGAWHVAVTVQRPGLPPVTDTHAWGVGGGPAPIVSAAPLRPVTTTLAVLLGAAVAIAGGLWWARRRRRAGSPVTAAEDQVTEPAVLIPSA